MDERIHDFRNFLYLAWEQLRLPDPTPVQYDIADYLQNGPKRSCIMAFRGVGKSWITSAFVCHQLLLEPQRNILVVSASKARADDFSTFTLRLISEMPMLQHLRPRENQRNSKIAFDVGPATASHAPSVTSRGITGQITGARADLIVADDVESLNNSATQTMRDKLSESIKEFDAVLKPEGRVVYLGTPQSEQSIYNVLPQRGYETRIWPARIPPEKQQKKMEDTLAPMVKRLSEDSRDDYGKPTDPQRFDEHDLLEREASYGRSGFALQFMLDTSLSDQSRYPLKLSDLVVMHLNPDTAPEKAIWAASPDLIWKDLPCVGFAGDRYYRPMQVQGDWKPYSGSVMAIDPSGRGADETAYAVAKTHHGQILITAAGGLPGGYEEGTLQRLADIAKEQKVNKIIIESNFGDGMFTKLLTPYITKTYPVTLEEVRHSTQKERRIIDTLEPVMNQHRLIVDYGVLMDDYESTKGKPQEMALKYTLAYQMTRITKDRGALKHDDRLDVLAMAVQYWVDHMAQDRDKAISRAKDQAFRDELEKFTTQVIGGSPKPHLWMNR